jgi:hypothetical protein
LPAPRTRRAEGIVQLARSRATGRGGRPTPQIVGITLTVASTLFLLFAPMVYVQQVRALARLKDDKTSWLSLALLVSLLVIVFGGTLSILMSIWT